MYFHVHGTTLQVYVYVQMQLTHHQSRSPFHCSYLWILILTYFSCLCLYFCPYYLDLSFGLLTGTIDQAVVPSIGIAFSSPAGSVNVTESHVSVPVLPVDPSDVHHEVT